MTDKFHIAVDGINRIVRIRVWGFWSEDEAIAYRDRLSKTMELMQGPEPWSVLADVRMFPIQPAPVQRIHGELMRKALLMGMARSANVVGGRLTRIQIERLAAAAWPEKGRFQYFTTEDDAESWLKETNDARTGTEDKKLIQSM